MLRGLFFQTWGSLKSLKTQTQFYNAWCHLWWPIKIIFITTLRATTCMFLFSIASRNVWSQLVLGLPPLLSLVTYGNTLSGTFQFSCAADDLAILTVFLILIAIYIYIFIYLFILFYFVRSFRVTNPMSWLLTARPHKAFVITMFCIN